MSTPSKKRQQPWLNALIATAALSLFFMLASRLWLSGSPEWAFVLGFLAVWVLLAVSWSNVDFTEKSGTLLARIVDLNFQRVERKVEALERELDDLRLQLKRNPSGS